MTKIYTRAQLVLVWLGEELPTDRAGLQLLQQVHEKLGENPYFLPGADPMQYHSFEALGLPDEYDQRWSAAIRILSRQWFTRIWAVQELVVARQATFLCGQVEARADSVISAAYYFSTSRTMRSIAAVVHGTHSNASIF